jgi:hypothetical protein
MRGGRSFATEGTEITLEILGAAKYCHAPPPLGVVIELEIKNTESISLFKGPKHCFVQTNPQPSVSVTPAPVLG